LGEARIARDGRFTVMLSDRCLEGYTGRPPYQPSVLRGQYYPERQSSETFREHPPEGEGLLPPGKVGPVNPCVMDLEWQRATGQ